MRNLPRNDSIQVIPPVVRASSHTTHFQAFRLSERIYFSDRRHDTLEDLRFANQRLIARAPVRYRMTKDGAVRIP